MKKVTQLCAELALPFVEQAGCTLWDVEYVREAGTWFLRVYIDAPGGVNIDQCEAVSRPLSDALDEQDPIEGSYVLEVGSAGADRALRKPEHFAAYLGSEVDVKLYRPRDGRKEFTGTLAGYEDGAVTLQIGADAVTFEKKEIALVRLHITL
jgi:ribosome maturation factor RimP